jgi:hypothetical protein
MRIMATDITGRTKCQNAAVNTFGPPFKLGFGLLPPSKAFGDPLEKSLVFIEGPWTTRALEMKQFSAFLRYEFP